MPIPFNASMTAFSVNNINLNRQGGNGSAMTLAEDQERLQIDDIQRARFKNLGTMSATRVDHGVFL